MRSWRGGRVVECTRLEIERTARFRGFESPPLRLVQYFITISRNIQSLCPGEDPDKQPESDPTGLKTWDLPQPRAIAIVVVGVPFAGVL